MHIKKLFTSFLFLCVSICTRAQYFENNYLSINIPEGWEINKQNMAAIDAEIVVFVNTGEEIYNLGMVMGMDRYMDAKSAIDHAQFSDIMTSMFQDVKIQESRASKFMGHSAYTKDFESGGKTHYVDDLKKKQEDIEHTFDTFLLFKFARKPFSAFISAIE